VSRQQLTLRIGSADVARAEALLELAGAESLLLTDAGDDPVLEPAPDEQPLWPGVVVRAVFRDNVDLRELCTLLRAACVLEGDPEVAPLADADWLDAARQHFAPRAFGARLWLAPAHTEPDAGAAPTGRVTVRLHMGLAFGTGEHPTTALCLEWLDANVRRGDSVLDYGCGSGVLAIAAIALGAEHAWAVDHDPQALTASEENTRLNGVETRVEVLPPERLAQFTVNTIVANILAGPLTVLAPELARRLEPGGRVVLSGILERQIARVTAAYEPYFEGLASTVELGWARVEGRRRSFELSQGTA
jgi:ribosomal protein L11 methyltransferase